MPHHGNQRSDVSRQITQFGKGLSSFSRHLENDIAELKKAASAKPHTGHAQMQHCLHDMLHRVSASGRDVSALEGMTIDAISLEEICGHCLQLFQENQARISHLETYLQQYGYQPQAGASVPMNPLELMQAADYKEAAPQSEVDADSTGPAQNQAQAASHRQPFRHVTNLSMGASPPSRQQSALNTSEGIHTGHKLQSMSLERITPTPSPVLSSSTDMPYSPSMRELQEKYGAASFGSYGTSHRDSIESVSMLPQEQKAGPASLSQHVLTPLDRSQGADTPRLPTPLSQHQLPVTQGSLPLSSREVTDVSASQHRQDPAKSDAHGAAKGVAEMQLTDAVDEETTMCLREQLIHSRCTESSTPDWYALTPAAQPAHMPPSAQAGSCCTPEQQAPTGRPKTPDTAKLLQRALASSSGTALLNSLSHGASKSHPGRLKPAGDAKPHPGGAGAVAASSESAQQSAAGPAAVPDPRVALVSSCMSTAAATDMGSAVLATAQARGSKDGCGVVLGATINQEALSQQQAQEPGSSNQSGAPQPAGTDQQHQVAPPSASVGQQQGGRQPAKQERQPWTGLLSDGQVNLDPQAGACQQISVELNPAEDYRHAGALQQREVGPVGVGSGASIADSARHVTPQEYLSLGTMQRKHFSLEKINSALDFMETLTSSGSAFSTEDLGSLQLGDMKTKMLLGSLTKLGKLRVHLQNGQIRGYFMHSAGL